MRFDEVLKWLLAGYKISRKSWGNSYIEYEREKKYIMYHGHNVTTYYVLMQYDILATDWRINLVNGFYEGEIYAD